MSLTINAKLKLSRVVKRITVKYNTFEKATFDEYLAACIVKRSGGENEAFAYIDEITGNGSLNAHFKALYADISRFDDATLKKIMTSSLYPREVIDSRNTYLYYPELDASVFNGKTFAGDLGGFANLARDVLYINEDVTDVSVEEQKTDGEPRNYTVTVENGKKITVKIADRFVDMSAAEFGKLVVKDELNMNAFGGSGGDISKNASGDGWNVLYAAAFNNLFNGMYFYADGKHCKLRYGGAVVTEIAEIFGLYVYRESNSAYGDSPELCKRALEYIAERKLFERVKGGMLANVLKGADGGTAAEFLSGNMARVIDGDIARFAMGLVRSGRYSWKTDALQLLAGHCDKADYAVLYVTDGDLHFELSQLLYIDRSLLSETDGAKVDKYYADLAAMKADIKRIMGEVVTSGLREQSKKLPNDKEVERFRRLCNDLQGHENRDIDKATFKDVEEWHKRALELSALLPKIKRKLGE